jgi:hypothetical protein
MARSVNERGSRARAARRRVERRDGSTKPRRITPPPAYANSITPRAKAAKSARLAIDFALHFRALILVRRFGTEIGIERDQFGFIDRAVRVKRKLSTGALRRVALRPDQQQPPLISFYQGP